MTGLIDCWAFAQIATDAAHIIKAFKGFQQPQALGPCIGFCDVNTGEGVPVMAPLLDGPALLPQTILQGFQRREGPMHHSPLIEQFIAVSLKLQQALEQ